MLIYDPPRNPLKAAATFVNEKPTPPRIKE
jgi:hypothetical protein